MQHTVSVSRFDDAALEALFVENTAPTWEQVDEAKARLPELILSASTFLFDYPVVAGKYAREQECFPYIRRLMQVAGWTYCGSGYYSAAFFKDGLCIKLGFKPEDSGGAYAMWCRYNQGAVGVPVIHKLIAKGLGYAVLMDRLEPIAGELEKGSSAYDPILAAEFEAVQDTINCGIDGWHGGKALCKTAVTIREFFADMANFDIHSKNVMLDRNGDLVITDPVSFTGDTLSGNGSGDSSYCPSDRIDPSVIPLRLAA